VSLLPSGVVLPGWGCGWSAARVFRPMVTSTRWLMPWLAG
jgi:hypothetical protein